MKIVYTCISAVWLLLCLNACAPQSAPITNANADTYFPFQLETATIQLQLALNQNEQTQGLMHREALPTDHGMLFIFKQPDKRSFWMRNTRIPLDLGYIDASGKLIEIHKLYPYDETPVPSYSSQILMALEMNQGWFQKNNIRPGAQLDLEAIVQAIRARGSDPNQFQLSHSQP